MTGSAPVALGQQQVLTGLLAARVARVDPLAEGLAHANAHASRSGRCRSVWLADPIAAQEPAQDLQGCIGDGNSGGGGDGGLTQLLLLDEKVRTGGRAACSRLSR